MFLGSLAGVGLLYELASMAHHHELTAELKSVSVVVPQGPAGTSFVLRSAVAFAAGPPASAQSELDALLPLYSSQSKKDTTEGIQWALLNKMDFVFNY